LQTPSYSLRDQLSRLHRTLLTFSWYDWPSEAPAANTYHAYSDQDAGQLERYNASIPYPSQAEIRHSFENQQQEYAQTVPSALTSNYYIPSASSFERDSTASTYASMQPRYFTAHQPIRPEQRSSYSELAPNLEYLNSQTKHSPVRQEPSRKISQDDSIPKRNGDATSSPGISTSQNPFSTGIGNGLALTAFGRKPDPPSPVPVTRPSPEAGRVIHQHL